MSLMYKNDYCSQFGNAALKAEVTQRLMSRFCPGQNRQSVGVRSPQLWKTVTFQYESALRWAASTELHLDMRYRNFPLVNNSLLIVDFLGVPTSSFRWPTSHLLPCPSTEVDIDLWAPHHLNGTIERWGSRCWNFETELGSDPNSGSKFLLASLWTKNDMFRIFLPATTHRTV